jgi:hypothetical protein
VSGWTLAESVTLEPKTRYLLEVHYEDSMCTLEVFCTTPTPEEFQGGCIPAAHFSLYHNPDHYVGANIAWRAPSWSGGCRRMAVSGYFWK